MSYYRVIKSVGGFQFLSSQRNWSDLRRRVFTDIISVLLRFKSMATSQNLHLPPPPHASLPACLAPAVDQGGGYPLVNVTCLSATLPLVNGSDYYCDNVAIKKEALHQNRKCVWGGGGVVSERWMGVDYRAVGNALRLQSIVTPCWFLLNALIDIRSWSICLSSWENERKSASASAKCNAIGLSAIFKTPPQKDNVKTFELRRRGHFLSDSDFQNKMDVLI